MTTIRPAEPRDLPALARVAAEHQVDPARHNAYLPLEAEAIAIDVEGVEDWPSVTAVAADGDVIVGWLLAELDNDMGRVWWWGPFAPEAEWDRVADALYDHLFAVLPDGTDEEEACGDLRADAITGWALRHGMEQGPGSALLRLESRPDGVVDAGIRPLDDRAAETVKTLHAEFFAAAHLTPDAVVASDEPRLVIERDGRIVGYVAYEMQSDGSGYIDFLAVAADRQGEGLGGLLVHAASQELFDAGATFVHLSVREENVAARRLYARVGFDEERVALPFRKGFSIGG